MASVAASQAKLGQRAGHAPMNHLHRWVLVEAERQRVLGHAAEASELYEHAIALATENNYVHEAALANELAAQFYFASGKGTFGNASLTGGAAAYSQWARWPK